MSRFRGGGGYASLPVPQLLKNDTDSTEFFKTKYLTILQYYQEFYPNMIFFFCTARDLGESCINSRQCRQRVTHTTCDTDRQCKCQPGFLKHNNSCSSGNIVSKKRFISFFFNIHISMRVYRIITRRVAQIQIINNCKS